MNIGWVSRLLCLAAVSAFCGYSASFSKCDVNQSGGTGVADVQTVINEVLGAAQANDDLNADGVVNVVDIQIDLNAALGSACTADPGLVSIVPNNGPPGATGISVTINGRLTSFSNSSVIGLGAGIVITNVSAQSATTLTATLAIDPAAATTTRNLTVDALTLANAFTVTMPSTVAFTYDSQGRLSTATYTPAVGAVTVVTYTYDAAGNRTSVVTR